MVIAAVVVIAAGIAGATWLAFTLQGPAEAGFVALSLLLEVLIVWAFVISPKSVDE